MTEFQEGLRETERTIDLEGGRSCEVKYRGKPIRVVLADKEFQIREVDPEYFGSRFLLIDPETFNPKNPQTGFVKLEEGKDIPFGRYHHRGCLTYNEYVSREHAQIRVEQRGKEYIITIRDLNSTNGTKVVVPEEEKAIAAQKTVEALDPRLVFELAGRRSGKEVLELISKVEEILRQEERRGRGKLGENIEKTRSGDFGNEYFVDGRIAYLPPRGEVIFVGDTHGDSISTEVIVKQTQFLEEMKRGNDTYLVFLGDYADRGSNDVRNLEIVLALKAAYPNNVILMMGNHEEGGSFEPYELPQSLEERFGEDAGGALHNAYTQLFRRLPNVLVTGNGIVALHGGIPKEDVPNLQALRNNEGLLNQIRWNDPNEQIEGFQSSPRGEKFYEFGRIPFEQFMRRIVGTVMVRSHEYPPEGYKLFFGGRLVTIFSNGSPSSESGYKEVSPKFMRVSLTEPIVKIDPQKHIFGIQYHN